MNSSEDAGPQVEGEQDLPLDKKLRRALLFKILSILWIFPSSGALWILRSGPKAYMRASTFLEKVEAVALEEWIAMLLLIAHMVFIVRALRSRNTHLVPEKRP